MPRIGPFEEHAEAYDRWFEDHADFYAAELEAVRRLLPPAAAEGMEVGVGSGRFAAPLGIRLGVEPSPRMAARARSQGVEVLPGTAEDLPFADGRFPLVLMVTTLCFVDDADRSFREAFRVLEDGGCLVVGFVDKESELGRRYSARKESSRFYRPATFYSAHEVTARLEKAGFGISRVLQALVPGEPAGTILEGHGAGAFVAVRAEKPRTG